MKQFLVETFQISETDAQLFSDSFERVHLNKGEKFISFGKVSDRVGFVEKGILKCTIIGDEKSVVDDFVFENQFVANYYSFLKNEKSNKEIICLEDSVLRIITREKLEELSSYPFIEQIARQVAEQLFISTAKKLEDLRLLSAEERYLTLININKRLTEEIPQYEIASFLNVSPETVSRIRKKITLGY